MIQQIPVGILLIPCLIFAFGLYVGKVPTDEKRNPSLKRTILCGIGIAFGLFLSISVLIASGKLMNMNQAYYYLLGIAIIGWCIYAFYTNHSKLTKWRKVVKVIVYWFVTGCFLSASSPRKDVSILAVCLGFITPIIAYYSGLIDKSKKETKKPDSTSKRSIKLSDCFNSAYMQLKRYRWIKTKSIKFYKEHRKAILIVIAIIILLVILPFILRVLKIYWEYVSDYAGFETKSYKRHKCY